MRLSGFWNGQCITPMEKRLCILLRGELYSIDHETFEIKTPRKPKTPDEDCHQLSVQLCMAPDGKNILCAFRILKIMEL